LNNTDADKWDERYSGGEVTLQPPHPLVLRAADLLPAGRALDVACGLGRHSLALAARGWHVTAVDVSSSALSRLADNDLIETIHADLTANDLALLPESYDLVVMTNYLQRDLFTELKQAVRVNGLFVAAIAMIDEDPQIKPMNPAFLLKSGELAKTFADWELIHCREEKSPGRRAMAEIIARRAA
jgi:tellurite methyltransferase